MGTKSVYFRSNKNYLLELSDNGQVEVLARKTDDERFTEPNHGSATPVLQKMAKDKGLNSSKEGLELAKELVANYGNNLVAGRAFMYLQDFNDMIRIWHYAPVSNRIEVLRGIAERISFKYDTDWDTNTLGAKLIEFL